MAEGGNFVDFEGVRVLLVFQFEKDVFFRQLRQRMRVFQWSPANLASEGLRRLENVRDGGNSHRTHLFPFSFA